jgi:hypothetical protein
MARMKVVHSLDEIPSFSSEAEEAIFWDTHEMSDELWDSLPSAEDQLPPPRPRTKPVAVRFDPDTIGRLKALADRKHKGYQTLLKEFVMERLYEEEKREGLVAS